MAAALQLKSHVGEKPQKSYESPLGQVQLHTLVPCKAQKRVKLSGVRTLLV